jgi:hypothetical protein
VLEQSPVDAGLCRSLQVLLRRRSCVRLVRARHRRLAPGAAAVLPTT